jgi:hypothetical protein
MQFRTIDGLSIRFAQSEDREDHALLLCPWPESLLAFDQIWSGVVLEMLSSALSDVGARDRQEPAIVNHTFLPSMRFTTWAQIVGLR